MFPPDSPAGAGENFADNGHRKIVRFSKTRYPPMPSGESESGGRRRDHASAIFPANAHNLCAFAGRLSACRMPALL